MSAARSARLYPLPLQEPEFSRQDRATLLRIARQSIESALSHQRWQPSTPHLRLLEPRAAFTTLHAGDQLRGCVGYVQAVRPLYLTVAETAVSAALQDPRFAPVTSQELSGLRIEISVLSALRPVTCDEVHVGRHGLVVTLGSSRGLLLPQVALEYGWDAATFVQQTAFKAGLPPDAVEKGATLEAFTAEVFGE